MQSFREALAEQRWDDHRYYHHSRINQSLHLVSALSFLVAYGVLFIDPALAAWIGWGFSMTTRQSGHFFFEPRGFDHVNRVTHAYKEQVKVGYNLRRKVALLSVWVGCPGVLYLWPSLFGLIQPASTTWEFVHDVGLLWLALGVAALLFRTVQLFLIRDVQTGLVWLVKILTDPFHDVKLYWKSPLYLLQGQRVEPAPRRR